MERTNWDNIQYKIVQNGIIWGAGALEEVYTTQGPVFLVRRAVVGRRSGRIGRLSLGRSAVFLRQSPVESTCRLGGAGFRGGGGGAQVGHNCPVLGITGFWGLSIVSQEKTLFASCFSFHSFIHSM